jgi:hypothetical protein
MTSNYPIYHTTSDPQNVGPSGDPWGNWQEYVKQLTLNPDDFPNILKQATAQAHLATLPASRNLQLQKSEAARQYKWGKDEIDPAYNRFVAEQEYNLGNVLANNALSRDTAAQDFDMSGRNLSAALKEQSRRTEMDMARRGLWQSGLLNKAYGGLQGKYLTSMGDLERSRATRYADIERTGDLAKQKATFNLSDAQRERVAKLNKLLEAYQGQERDIGWREQSLSEEEGTRLQATYAQLLQQAFANAIAGREQGLAESQFHSDAWWQQTNADEDKRRYELQRQLDAAARKAQGLAY